MALQDVVRSLSALPTLGLLDQEAMRLIAFSAETRILRAGDVLFREGTVSDGGFVVLSGTIAMEHANGTITLVRPPALIGDTALVAETIRPCAALAREPSSILKIPRSLFHRVLTEFPDSAVKLHRALSRRLAGLGDELADIAAGGTS